MLPSNYADARYIDAAIDVATALVSSKMKGIQNLHDSMAPQIASGASYADLADNINIPDRVFLIPMLIAAFDKSIAEKKIKVGCNPTRQFRI